MISHQKRQYINKARKKTMQFVLFLYILVSKTSTSTSYGVQLIMLSD